MSRAALWKKWVFYIAMGAITLVTTLVLSELLMRVSGRVTVKSVHTASEKDFDRIPGTFDPGQNLIETPHPKLIHHVSINALGFRGPEISRKPKSGTVRILCLGDSGTYGHYVNDDETFPFYLQERFTQENLPVEVINAGVPDTTIIDQLYYLKRSIEIEPDIVILTFSENDITDLDKDMPTYLSLQNNRKLKSSGIIGLIYGAARDTALFNFALLLKAKVSAAQIAGRRIRETEARPNDVDRFELLWKQYEDYLREMKQYLEQRGVRFVFNVFPSHHRIGKDSIIDGRLAEQLDRVEMLAGKMGVQTINILQPLQKSGLSKNELTFLPYDGHASRKAYFIQANTVFAFLREDVLSMLSSP